MSKKSFQTYVGIDWSGAKTPERSYAISLAFCHAGTNTPMALTDKLSRNDVYEWISQQIQKDQKTLIGIDCNLGYAAHIVRQQLGENADYTGLWSSIDKCCSEQDNFFAGPWWQDPEHQYHFWQKGKQPQWFSLSTLRRQTESKAIDCNLGTPESPFKLIGAKQVGKGGLAGMRVMQKLKVNFNDKIAIWPFESHLVDDATVVVSENFPRLFIRRAGFGNQKIRTLDILNDALSYFQSEHYESNAELNDHLTDAIIASAGMRWTYTNEVPLSVDGMSRDAKSIEGWIFGVPT